MIGQILPVFAIIGAGALLKALKIADDKWVGTLNRYGLYIGFPALIFLNLVRLDGASLEGLGFVLVSNVLLLTAVMGGIFLILKKTKLPPERGNVYLTCTFFGNVAYLGYPLIAAVRPAQTAEISLIIVIYSVSLFSLGILFLEWNSGTAGGKRSLLRAVVLNPFVLSISAGLLCRLLPFGMPPVLLKALEMLKASASPVVLVSLGIFLVRSIDFRAIRKDLIRISLLKMLALPLLFSLWGGLSGRFDEFAVSILMAGLPPAVTTFALSDRYPMSKQLAVSAIFLNTLSAPLLFPLLAGILG